jgi:uncharacterized surface protein with fasciclin (FAS1) repeats
LAKVCSSSVHREKEKSVTRIIALAVLLASLTLVAVACGGDDDEPASAPAETAATMTDGGTSTSADEMTIVDTAVAAGDFTTLVSLVQEAGLADELSGAGPLTVFAPTDEAFAAVPEATLEELRSDPDALRDVLLYHVVEGAVTSDKVVGLDSAPTLAGAELTFQTEGDAVLVDGATVVQPDVMASNGVIHVVDAVLVPAR